jgi:pyridoxamine 5'-phosphate oxidase
MKQASADGFLFFTNYGSRKARELDANPRAALLFYWQPLGRQVRIEGPVTRVDASTSDAYYDSRPLGARLGAWASPQSEVIESRDVLEQSVAEARERFGSQPARPPHWGGFRVQPEVYEFWQHQDDRLHDRLRYRREAGSWVRERLAP